MTKLDLPSPYRGETTEETVDILLDVVFKLRKELLYVMRHLDGDNIESINVEQVEGLDDGYFNNLIANAVLTQTLTADYGYIAELTVDQLSTSTKVQNYLNSDTSDVNYIFIHKQNIDFITAKTDGTATEQLINRYGRKLYWMDESKQGFTYENTGIPVIIYVYEETTKMTIKFMVDPESGYYIPIFNLGAGDGVTSLSSKGFIKKGQTGIDIVYHKSNTGDIRSVRLNDDGVEIFPSPVRNYNISNSSSISLSTTETTMLSKSINFEYRAKLDVHVSCCIETDGACDITAKTYVDGTALTYQPVAYVASASKFVFSYICHLFGIEEGIKAVTVKLQTSANGGTISAGQATMSINVFSRLIPDILDVSSFLATMVGDEQIDLSWENPIADSFDEVELYASTSDISSQDRAWCDSNADLIYNGSTESYSDTGLDSATIYYYKIFAKYITLEETFYSDGVSTFAETDAVYQQWNDYPQSPLSPEDYPYQFIGTDSIDDVYLFMSTQPWYRYPSYNWIKSHGSWYVYKLVDNEWEYDISGIDATCQRSPTLIEANNDFYTDDTLTTVAFAKTT